MYEVLPRARLFAECRESRKEQSGPCPCGPCPCGHGNLETDDYDLGSVL